MTKLSYLIIAASLTVFACTHSKKDEQVSKLKHQKYQLDSTINAESLVIYVKVKDKPGLITAEKGRNLKNIEAAYNVFKDASGTVRYIAELPFSPKDDWFIAYKSYFDSKGKLFAFQRENNFFGSKCTKGAAMENLLKFYNDDFTVADSSYSLTDTKKTPLDRSTCKFPYNFPYTVNKTLNEYKKERGIKEL